MSDYAILRLEKRSMGQAAAMARHALREQDTPNADPDKRGSNTIYGKKTAAGVMADLRARLPEKRRKDAVPCLEFFVGASPEAMHGLSRTAQDSYFKKAVQFIADRFGGAANIVLTAIHRDEQTPHAQVLLVPLLDGKLNAKKLVGNRHDMEQLQTDFAEQVGKPFGLRRGEKRSKAKHTSIRQFYGAIQAAGSRDALPQRVPMPPPLLEPGMLSSRAERAAYEKREAERERARLANKERQFEIERLARAALATRGKPAKDLDQVIAERDSAKADAEAARRVVSDQRKRFREVEQGIEAKKSELAELSKRAAELSKTVARMNERADSARPPAPSNRSREGR